VDAPWQGWQGQGGKTKLAHHMSVWTHLDKAKVVEPS